MVRKAYFDTEFIQYDLRRLGGIKVPVAELISIGIVDDTGRTYMAVSSEFNYAAARRNEWVARNVLAKLPPQSTWKSRKQIREEICAYLAEQPTRMHYYLIPNDAVLLDQLVCERFDDLPKGLLRPYVNLGQEWHNISRPDIFPPKENEHDVLCDARWAQALDVAIDQFKAQRQRTLPKPSAPSER
jgi:hypothetical protein